MNDPGRWPATKYNIRSRSYQRPKELKEQVNDWSEKVYKSHHHLRCNPSADLIENATADNRHTWICLWQGSNFHRENCDMRKIVNVMSLGSFLRVLVHTTYQPFMKPTETEGDFVTRLILNENRVDAGNRANVPDRIMSHRKSHKVPALASDEIFTRRM